jgi:uncharacterized protein YbaR (Trm112 family)
MHTALLDLLRCPFCGTALDLVESTATRRVDDVVTAGVLGCQCCAFPIVDGIPVLVADDAARRAMHLMEEDRHDDALTLMLGLDERRTAAFRALFRRETTVTYRDALEVLSPDAEGTYFVYRFSDPTFVMAEAIIRALSTEPRRLARVIDLCGGSGHLTRVIAGAGAEAPVLADAFFWKLWLARHFVAPSCEPLCCDGNSPLPFTAGAFSMVVLSDAFPYIWHKRLLAGEMMRLTAPDGVVVMPHLHSALGFNYSAGMTLTPAAYRDLFEGLKPRLFRDSDLLNGVLTSDVVELSTPVAADAFGEEPSLTLVAGHDHGLYARHELPSRLEVSGELRVNPLYRVEPREGGGARLTLAFPTPEYEEEFGASRRYLPDVVDLPIDPSGVLASSFGSTHAELRRRRVLLDVPRRYC